MTDKQNCPNCLQAPLEVFHRASNVPTNSCILLETRRQARDYPTGRIELGLCQACGFIGNQAFEPQLTEYSERYEETQGFSPTFNRFHRELAQRVIERFDLHGKDVLEIGCGKGEFLVLLAELGGNRGVGFDPGYREDRNVAAPGLDVRFVTDFYSEKYAHEKADFVCCKMTLEHIQPTLEFMRVVRAAIGDRPDTAVFFQIPDTIRIIEQCAFEDVYYEHCSYFSPYSLAHLFTDAGFDVQRVATEYDDQYLTIEAQPAAGTGTGQRPAAEQDAILARVREFPRANERKLQHWRHQLATMTVQHKKAVIWGSGSKGVAFLSSVGVEQEIGYAVDINPHRHGYFMPGSGLEIVGPEFLREYKPDVVIIMNAIYEDEISRSLHEMGLGPEVLTV